MKTILSLFEQKKIIVLADQFIFSGTSFLSTIILAHLLSPSHFGLIASIIIFIYLAISGINALVVNPLQVYFSKIENTSEYLSFATLFQLALTTFVLTIVYLVLSLDFELLKSYSAIKFPFILFAFGFLMQDYFRKLYLALNQVKQTLIIDSLASFFQVVSLGSIFFFQINNLSVLLFLLAFAYLPALLMGLNFIPFRSFKYASCITFLKEHLKEGKWLLMTAIIQWWSGNLFVVSSGVFLGIEALGAFRLVQSVFGVVNVILQTFENYALPLAAKLYGESKEKSEAFLQKLSRQSILIFSLVLAIVFFFSESIITIAGGEEYRSYAYVVKGMVILYIFIFIGSPIRIAIRTLSLNKVFFGAYLLSLLFSLFSFQYLLNHYQLIGAIIGLISAQLIVLIFWQIILYKNQFSIWK